MNEQDFVSVLRAWRSQDAKKEFFSIRLWDQGNPVNAILENYERLDDEMKAELPMKRIWLMVKDDVDG